MPITSPNMALIVPIASSGASGTGDVGPGYASNISNDLFIQIDTHDHSFGKGVQVSPAGINISSDLNFNSHNLTSVRGVRFTSQASALSGGGDTNEPYVKNGDLWFVNGSGVQVQITSGSALGTGPVGPTGPGGTSFVSNYFQAGVTGTTGCSVGVVDSPSPASGTSFLVKWNAQQIQLGGVSTPTGQGTGSAWVNITAAGLYEVFYSLTPTGGCASGLSFVVQQRMNATGAITGGTGIPASVSFLVMAPSGIQGPNPSCQNKYIVQLAAGSNVETWVTPLVGPTGFNLSQTGTNLSIKQIG